MRCALQLVDHPTIRPSNIHNPEVLAQYADDFLYLGCVRFVKQVGGGGVVGGQVGATADGTAGGRDGRWAGRRTGRHVVMSLCVWLGGEGGVPCRARLTSRL